MHCQIHCSFFPSCQSHENYSCVDLRFIFFGKDDLNLHVVLGVIIVVVGMIWYGNASSKPWGKEHKPCSSDL
ncbi:hypothetical protein Sjap_010570 [Stephania japonica]|uniref:Transmembrane protein n=1 Tax=Stephania japonica TaxID=461633 RepID=A0AAP0JBU6_9MAGN